MKGITIACHYGTNPEAAAKALVRLLAWSAQKKAANTGEALTAAGGADRDGKPQG